jgi:hypothetical protein
MTLSEQFCGIKHAPLSDRERWIAKLKLEHPTLTDAECLREWNERVAQFYGEYGYLPGT